MLAHAAQLASFSVPRKIFMIGEKFAMLKLADSGARFRRCRYGLNCRGYAMPAHRFVCPLLLLHHVQVCGAAARRGCASCVDVSALPF
jgi:hypothetical protein